MSSFFEPYFSIKINQKTVPNDMLQYVASIDVEDAGAKASVAKIEVFDRKQVWINDKGIVKGTLIEVIAGTRTKKKQIFTGRIQTVEPSYPADGVPVTTITAMDGGLDKMNKKRTRTFKNKKISDVMKTMFKEGGVVAEVQDSKKVISRITQKNETNAQFIERHRKKLKWNKFKELNGHYYVGSRSQPKTKVGEIGYATGKREVMEYTPAVSSKEEDV